MRSSKSTQRSRESFNCAENPLGSTRMVGIMMLVLAAAAVVAVVIALLL